MQKRGYETIYPFDSVGLNTISVFGFGVRFNWYKRYKEGRRGEAQEKGIFSSLHSPLTSHALSLHSLFTLCSSLLPHVTLTLVAYHAVTGAVARAAAGMYG